MKIANGELVDKLRAFGYKIIEPLLKDAKLSNALDANSQEIQNGKLRGASLVDALDANGQLISNLLALVLSQSGDDVKVRKDGAGSVEFYNDTDNKTIFSIDQDSGEITLRSNIKLQGNGLVGLENVDNIAAVGDMTGDIAIDEAQERVYLVDDAGNLGYINLDGVFTA